MPRPKDRYEVTVGYEQGDMYPRASINYWAGVDSWDIDDPKLTKDQLRRKAWRERSKGDHLRDWCWFLAATVLGAYAGLVGLSFVAAQAGLVGLGAPAFGLLVMLVRAVLKP
jgi:hypothetical protein